MTRRLLLPLVALLAIGAPRAASADWRRYFQFDDLHATYELLGGYQYEQYDFPLLDAPDIVRNSLIIGERLGGSVTGSIFHPRFWKYHLNLNLLLLQMWSKDSLGNEGWGHKEDAEFDFDSTFLGEHPYPVHLFARRHTDILRRDFTGHQTVTSTSFGGDFAYRNKVLPLRMSISRTYNDYGAGLFNPGDDAYTYGVFEVRRDGARDEGTLAYRLYQYSNDRITELDYLAHEFTLQHVWYPGEDVEKKYRVDSRYRYALRYAGVDRDDGQALERLTIRWLPELENRFSYAFSTVHSQGVRRYLHTLATDLRYRLYESLFFGAMVQGSTDAATENTRWEVGTGLDVTYRKKVLDWFVMSHGYQFLLTQQYGGLTEDVPVFDEAVTLTGFEPVLLRNPGARSGTVMVIDAVTQQQYLQGADYELRPEGDRLLISRSPSSRIADGGAVLVSYRYDLDSDQARTMDHRYTGRIRTTFSRYVSLFADVSLRWTNRTAPGRETARDRYDSYGGGISANWRWLATAFDVHWYRTERFQSLDHSGSLTLRPDQGAFRPAVGGRYLLQRLSGGGNPGELRLLVEAFAEGDAAFTKDLGMKFRWRYHFEDGGPSDGHYLDGESALEYRFRELFVRLEYRLQTQLRETQRYQNQRVFLSIGRPL